MKQFLVISYDISNDKRRRKVMKIMEGYGKRVQYSVFECYLLPSEFIKLKKSLKPFVLENQDSVRFYFISSDDVARIQVVGTGKVTEEKIFFLQ